MLKLVRWASQGDNARIKHFSFSSIDVEPHVCRHSYVSKKVELNVLVLIHYVIHDNAPYHFWKQLTASQKAVHIYWHTQSFLAHHLFF